MNPTDYILDSALVLIVLLQIRERTLTNCWQHYLGREDFVHHRRLAESLQPAEREDETIELSGSQFAEARVDIAADRRDVEIGPMPQ